MATKRERREAATRTLVRAGHRVGRLQPDLEPDEVHRERRELAAVDLASGRTAASDSEIEPPNIWVILV